MKTIFSTLSFVVLLVFTSCKKTTQKPVTIAETTPEIVDKPVKSTKKIQLAILLDTSNSMDGLIEQAKNQLWKIVNQLAKAKDSEGLDPKIELALYQYGNDDLSTFNGYIEKVSGFTTELDEISENLFALNTNGGAEYCGAVIGASLDDLQWSTNDEDLHIIFIAGNEPFDQGNVSYKSVCTTAKENSISINTIYCGDYDEGINKLWQKGATLGNGKYMNIDHDAKTVHIASPYDTKIQELNDDLNNTYLPYGSKGSSKKEKQLKEDANANSYGTANAVKRSISKGSKVYKNKSWDLVDAAEEESFEIEDVENNTLPTEMQNMNTEEKKQYIVQKQEERKRIQTNIKKLSVQREQFVTAEKLKNVNDSTKQLDDVIIKSIVDQAETKSYSFEK